MSEPLDVLERLGDEFARVAATDDAATRRRRRRRPRGLLLALPAALTIAGGALAASHLLAGDPIRNPPGIAFVANEGQGAPLPASGARLSPLRVADPVGGPAWGLRLLRTTRNYGCVQIGRVVDGRLGVLGQDGIAEDDGRFHERPANIVAETNCRPADATGHTFIAVVQTGLPAAGISGGCVPHPGPNKLPTCPPQDMRNLFYGRLGPQAQSVTYRGNDGKPHTSRVHPGDGAYLIVLRPTGHRHQPGRYLPTATPINGLISVRYRSGRICHIADPRRLGGARPCPLVGYVPRHNAKLTSADVAAAITVTEAARTVTPSIPPGVHGIAPVRQRSLTISFIARQSTDPNTAYVYDLQTRRRGHLPRCDFYGLGGATTRDVTAGKRVRFSVLLPATCNPIIDVTVRYHRTSPRELSPGPVLSGPRDPLVGHATKRLRTIPEASTTPSTKVP